MKRKKLIVVGTLALAFIGLLSFQNAAPDETGGGGGNGTSRDWEVEQPIVDSMWVQKLATPLESGANMIMRVKYLEDGTTLPNTLQIYRGENSIVFHDDGIAPDNIANDGIYAAYNTDDIPAFVAQMTAINTKIQNAGEVTEWQGHDAIEVINPALFELANFDAGIEVIVPITNLSSFDCSTDLIKQNSLFITDLSVTEDLSRTFKVYEKNPTGNRKAEDGSGNPTGAWTFGQMIKNMANYTVTGVTAKAFLKEWVESWVNDQTVNGQTVHSREDVKAFLIFPWLIKANPDLLTPPLPALPISLQTVISQFFDNTLSWETIWDSTPEDDLLKNAPFKLSAIVNRLDLRANPAYKNSLGNSGETRFIFSLIAPISGNFEINDGLNHGGVLTAGEVPFPSHTGDLSASNLIDWRGMNVIFEYQNVQTTACGAQSLAQQWANLSSLTMGTGAYNDALQIITDQVTAANAVPGKPNGSAIGRIRTNEKIFAPADQSSYPSQDPTPANSWEIADWELRQFEINPNTHLPQLVPVANTPVAAANYASLSNQFSNIVFGGLTSDITLNPNDALVNDLPLSISLLDWTYANRFRVLLDQHVIPQFFPAFFMANSSSTTPMLAGSALLQMDYVHTWDFPWRHSGQIYTYTPTAPTVTFTSLEDRNMRHHLALQTCQGCHGGETKTIFTQVRPLAYGEAADYADPNIPGYQSDVTNNRHLDTRFSDNEGTTGFRHSGGPDTHEPNYDKTTAGANQYFVKVSAFITGRNYTKIGSAAATYDDDNHTDDASDGTLDGYFWVNDPINSSTNATIPLPDNVQHYFNELKLRQANLCKFLSADCSSMGTISILSGLTELGPKGD